MALPRCEQCGASVAEDQEWCLECGTARTLIHRPPDWRVPVMIGVVVVALVAAGIAIALGSLGGSSHHGAAAQLTPPAAAPGATTPAASASTPAASTPASGKPPPAPPAIASWPVGLGGYTVILGVESSQAAAGVTARRIHATGIRVGVLYSSEHRSLTPGLWVVFSGRYPTLPAASAASARLQAAGQPTAHPHLVAPPGG